MKFNIRKYKAFTVGELMIMLSVLTILLAAFAPVFTVRYNNASSEYVWQFVPDSTSFDAYTDQISKALTAQSFIGITPASKAMATSAVSVGSNVLYSKFVIRPTHFTFDGHQQKTIQFRYGDDMIGTPVGTLYARNRNILFGDSSGNVNGTDNTSFGFTTGGDISTSTSYNTLIGNSIVFPNSPNNTFIGTGLGKNTTSGGNTIVGFTPSTSDTATSSNYGSNNVFIGHNIDSFGSANTLILLNNSRKTAEFKSYNTYLGIVYVDNQKLGTGNTVVGGNFWNDPKSTSFDYNTVIGNYAGSSLGSSAKYKTCIGYGSCRSTSDKNVLTDSVERVFIGGPRADYGKGNAILEVHNVASSGASGLRSNAGNESVLINGNLIVRGQPYFSTGYSSFGDAPALIGFRLIRPEGGALLGGNDKDSVFSGYDGALYSTSNLQEKCRGCRGHDAKRGRENCTCVLPVTSLAKDGSHYNAKSWDSTAGYKSYDWTSYASNYSDDPCPNQPGAAGTQYDSSVYKYFYKPSYSLNYAHPISGVWSGSCCPNLSSDIRLKNLSGKFIANLDAIRKINAYNYTFKNDSAKRPQVGVMAQDLKLVFPNAVTKDESGYYQIRWDEMLYSAINAFKALNERFVNLAQRIAHDKQRVSALKKDNADLINRLDVLSNELSALENKK